MQNLANGVIFFQFLEVTFFVFSYLILHRLLFYMNLQPLGAYSELTKQRQ